jgi:fructokinase
MDRSTILVCGEALFDVFCGDASAAGLQLEARAAGSPFNVAIGLARLGRRVAFCGALSNGALGRMLRARLEAEGIDSALAPAVDAPTTLSLVETDASGSPRYTFYGEQGADRRWPAGAELPELPDAIGLIQLGSYPLVVEPVASGLRALVERERGRRLISCDVNLRLGVEPSLERWRVAVEWMARRAQLMKASDEDLALLQPGEETGRIVQRWREAGCALVVVTHGAHGASAWSGAGRVHVPAEAVEVVDTVGAGDAFQAAWLCRLGELGHLRPDGLRLPDAAALSDALAFATRAAAQVCTRRGADPARRSEL